ncbi:MAG: glycosyltransferase family 39 protein [Anaerolineae bacterium]|nr:glycosyltransferase family 39 protein [Anaerolineae bacterium]
MGQRTSTLVRVSLGLILCLGLFLRLWRLDYGQELPYLAHTDEPTQYNPALRIIKSGDLNPHFFNYPSLTIYLNALVMYAGYGVGRLAGAFQSLDDLQPIRTVEMAVGVVGTPSMLLLGRATTALLGTATVGVVYAAAHYLSRRKWVPVAVALMLAISSAHVRFSHYMTVDVIATFFAVACVAACTAALYTRAPRYLWIAALCGGLAASSKYNYAVLAAPVGLTAVIAVQGGWGRRVAHLAAAGALYVLAFALTSPYVLLDFRSASAGIAGEIRHYATGHLGVTGNSMVWYLSYLWSVNPAYLLLGVPGLALVAWRRRSHALPLVVTTLTYLLLIGNQAVHFDRNVLPVMVLLMVSAGACLEALADWMPGWVRRWQWGKLGVSPVVALMVLASLLPSLWQLPAFLQPPRPSAKAQAQAWFDAAAATPETARRLRALKVVAEAYTVYLDPEAYDVSYVTAISDEAYGLLGYRAGGYDLVLAGSGMFDRFYLEPELYARQVRVYDEFFTRVPDALVFRSDFDPLGFRGPTESVYCFFLTPEARAFRAAVEQGQ